MTRRELLSTAAGAAGALALGSRAGAAPGRRPNVLLVMTDDQGWGDLRCHGNERIDTPVLDRLATEGAHFERFYVCPLCAPTRASLLTGRYHLRTGVSGVTRGLEVMRSEEVTLAAAFRAAGYATGCFGKWHNGAHYPHHPNGQGFDEFLGFCAGHWNNYFDTTLERNGEPVATRGFITDVLTDAALSFIRERRDAPFFCYVPYNAPHGPFQVPDRYYDKYRGRGLGNKDACVYGMVENVDENVGRLLRALDELRLANDTIVIFLTDNGPNGARFNGDMRGAKGSAHEGGVRVPCFVRWPGRVKPGTAIRPIAAHIDLLPTLVELCGIPMPKTLPLDGISLAPLLAGRSEAWRDRRLFTNQANRGAVRTQRWRLVREGRAYQLYDMQEDPGQQRDLAKERPRETAELAAAYEEWLADAARDGLKPPPIPVGHPQAKRVVMPAPDSSFEGGVRFKGGQGWANDWLAQWRSTDDRIWWEVDVVRPGRYEITLMYTCPQADVGSRVRVDVGGQALEGVVERAHDPAPLPSPDRVARNEVYEKVWAPLRLGAASLPAGRTRLEVRALSKPGAAVMELKAAQVVRVE